MNTPRYSFMLLPSSDPHGKPVFSVVAKTQYSIGRDGRCQPAPDPVKLIPADRFFDEGDPLVNACEVESDQMPWKLMTDVVVIGGAIAPRNRPVIRMGVSVQVGTHRKSIVVSGDRKVVWKTLVGPAFTEPEPFVELPIRYERAYGGVDIHSTQGATPLIYARNPIGRGFAVKKKKEVVEGMLLPNIEDPNAMLTPEGLCALEPHEWHRMPFPAGLGVFGKGWYPRCSFVGVMPADMPVYERKFEENQQLVPPDQVEKYKSLKQPMLDFKFFNGASPGLMVPYLNGNETVEIEGMTADGPLRFVLPGGRPAITVDYGEGVRTTEVVLHTIVIRPTDRTVDLTWRGATEYPGIQELDKITTLDITVEPPS